MYKYEIYERSDDSGSLFLLRPTNRASRVSCNLNLEIMGLTKIGLRVRVFITRRLPTLVTVKYFDQINSVKCQGFYFKYNTLLRRFFYCRLSTLTISSSTIIKTK